VSEPDGAAPSLAGEASRYARPEGVDGSFAPREPLPLQPMSRPDVSAGAAAEFGPPAGSPPGTPYAALPGERIVATHGVRRAPVDAALQAAFRRSGPGDEPFEPAPGTRIDASWPPPASPWWKEDAATDPWRDPSSPFWLGAPARYIDERPVAPSDGEPAPEDEPEEEPSEDTGKVVRGRFGLTALLLALVVALVAGSLGGGVGYWISKHATESLRDPDVTLAKTGGAANRPPGSVADIAKRIGPAVVQIDVVSADGSGAGSGVVIDQRGYILTNNHVISEASSTGSIQVIFSDQSVTEGKVVGRDPATDLAVLKVTQSHLTVATLGDSDKVAVGDPVVAIGSPLGLQGTVTTGIVSALDRPVHVSGEGSDTDAVIDAIQTDAAINPGNSGGALVAADGAVIGINSAIASLGSGGTGQSGSIGLGFAIPINSARDVANQLIKTGRVAHASLGASTRSVTDGNRLGAYILQITPGGPAAKAGLKEGDVIKLIDGKLITSADDLTVAVQKHKPGDVVTLRYVRASKEFNVKVTLGSA
jgi:S1-C subfamily serine protease